MHWGEGVPCEGYIGGGRCIVRGCIVRGALGGGALGGEGALGGGGAL